MTNISFERAIANRLQKVDTLPGLEILGELLSTTKILKLQRALSKLYLDASIRLRPTEENTQAVRENILGNQSEKKPFCESVVNAIEGTVSAVAYCEICELLLTMKIDEGFAEIGKILTDKAHSFGVKEQRLALNTSDKLWREHV